MRIGSLLVTMLCGATCTAYAADLKFDSDRMAVINGERTFILGLYETFQDLDEYKNIADAGFNLVRPASTEESLDTLADLNIYACLQTGNLIDLADDRANREKLLRATVERFQHHPALLVWEVPDEPLWNAWLAPEQWRTIDEPAQLEKLVTRQDSKRVSSETRASLERLKDLHAAGKHAEGEKVADAIWKALGKQQPYPELSMLNVAGYVERKRKGMLNGYRFLKTIDAANPVWMNHAPRNQIAALAKFNEAADIVGCDMYPAPSFSHNHSDIADQTLSAVGAYTLRMQAASPSKPVWMVLQAFGWNDLLELEGAANQARYRRPNAHELRFMAYDAIVRGARGVLYWGSSMIPKRSRLRNDVLALVRELANLQPILAAPETTMRPILTVDETGGSVDRSIELLTKDTDGRLALILVNEWTDRLHYRITGLDAVEGVTFENIAQDLRLTVVNGEIAATLPAYGVHVLQQIDVDASH